MSFLEINKSDTTGINKSFILNTNLITHYTRIDDENKCLKVNLNHKFLAGYTNEEIPRIFTICKKDNNNAIIKLERSYG